MIQAGLVKKRTTIHKLVSWYQTNHREMPWRQTTDPYAIWVSETMLQQTRVETVIPYFETFMSELPTVRDLAVAEDQFVLKLWQGLGYYSRARNLHAAAKQVVHLYDGDIPQNVDDFRSLPGVGPYTAGAVFSIAHNQPVPAVDGNVLRVMTRYLGIFDPIETSSAKKQVTETVAGWLMEAEPRILTQALMELGATVCTPTSANCAECPLQAECFAYREASVDQLPVRKKKQARRQVSVAALWWEVDGQVWMERRPDQGLLAGMWQLPACELEIPTESDNAIDGFRLLEMVSPRFAEWVGETPDAMADTVREKPLAFAEIARERHVFSHLEWDVHVFRPVALHTPRVPESEDRRVWLKRNELDRIPVPRVYEKLLQSILGNEKK